MYDSKLQELNRLRERLLCEDRIVEFYDYGAGSPSDKRTREEMERGVKVSMRVSDLASIGIKSKWQEYLFNLVSNLKPNIILELGTCLGFSAMTMAIASPFSKIYTIEGAKELAEIAMDNYKKMEIENIIQLIGRFKDLLDDLLFNLKQIDFALIDGHHDRDATIYYYEKIRPFMSKNSIMFFDDISWSDGMKEAWGWIVEKESVENCEDLGKIGICHIK